MAFRGVLQEAFMKISFTSRVGASQGKNSLALPESLLAARVYFWTAFLWVFLWTTCGMAETLFVDACLPESIPESNSYHTLTLAVANASAGDDIKVQGGVYPESLVIDKRLTITAPGGTALIGEKYTYDVGTIDVMFPQLVEVCWFGGQDPLPIDARVYYPARCDTLLGGGGPFPTVVYIHGFRDPDWELCGGDDWPDPGPVNWDYRQAEGIIGPLVASGHIVMSFDASCSGYSGVKRGELALNALAYLRNQNEPGGILEGVVDLTRVGFMGHSLGGGGSVYAATQIDDPLFATLKLDTVQVKAVALIAPDFTGTDGLKSELIEPVLIIYGTADKFCDGFPTSHFTEPYNDVNSANKHLLAITGANHFGYTDGLCVLGKPYFDVDPPSTVGGATGPEAHARQQQTAGNYIHAFFSHYLQGVSGKIEYLVQEGEQQCIAESVDGICIEHPTNSGQPLLPFDDLVALDVEVSICSCLE